jgi:hypothetical protein
VGKSLAKRVRFGRTFVGNEETTGVGPLLSAPPKGPPAEGPKANFSISPEGLMFSLYLRQPKVKALVERSKESDVCNDTREEMLYHQEKVLAFDFSHCGKVRLEVVPPQVIKTIEHEA